MLFVYKLTFSVIFCWLKRPGVLSQFSYKCFHPIHFHSQTFESFSKGVYWSEDKQARNLVSFESANFEMSKIYQGNIQSSCYLAQLFLDTFSVIVQKKEWNRWIKFFSSFENAVWLILLKYQDIYMQIQTFIDKNWYILHNYVFEQY